LLITESGSIRLEFFLRSHFVKCISRLTEYFEHRNVCLFLISRFISYPTLSPQVEDLYLNPPSWYAEQQPDRFRYHLSETVTSLSSDEHLVYTSKGRSFRYDKCVLATGSNAGLPPYMSPDKVEKTRGVFVYRNISDLNSIISYAEKDDIKHAVIVGGGLLGLEAAKAVYDLET